MKNWGFWDWVSYLCVGAAILIAALDEALKRSKTMAPSLPDWMSSTLWVFVPVVLFIIGSVIFVVRAWRHKPPSSGPNISDAQAQFQAELKHKAAINRLALTGQMLPPVEPQPIFGSPCQEAREHYRSWWHIPISVSKSAGQNKIELATVDLVWDDDKSTIALQWQKSGFAAGMRETTLIEGRAVLTPIAWRDEPGAPEPRKKAAITGSSVLNNAVDRNPLGQGIRRRFRLKVRSGTKSWDSPQRYWIHVPKEEDHGNSQFFVQVWREEGD